MKFKTLIIGCVCLCFLSGRAKSQDVELPSKEKFHLYLLAGQSNMAGRGTVEARDKEIHARVLTLNKMGEWVYAQDPIHFDKPIAGVGPGRSFGKVMADSDPSVTVGLIPCAVGGSGIDAWQEGAIFTQTNSRPYDDALTRTRRAMKDGTLKGMLWHQGENDSNKDLAKNYQEKLVELFKRVRKEFDDPEFLIVIGQLGQFESNPWTEYKTNVDAAHKTIAENDPFTTFVSSDGLACGSDNIHFDSASMREFGRRYAKALQKMNDK